MNLELEGKRALVSGSTAGIGYAIAEALATFGQLYADQTEKDWAQLRRARKLPANP